MSSPNEVSDRYALDQSNVEEPTTTLFGCAKRLKHFGPGFIPRWAILGSGLVAVAVQPFIKLD